MKPHRRLVLLLTLSLAATGPIMASADPSAPIPVTLLRTPDNGIQPQAELDAKGTLHLIYFKGQPMAGDIFYVHSEDAGQTFSPPLRVNSQPGSAIAMGTVRGAQMAIGKNNRVHVAWNGSKPAEPRGPGGTPMLYTRLNDDATAFEPQRNLITWAGGLDGGGAIAADARGAVYVAWHAAPADKDEADRAVYLTRSRDGGRSFDRERKINPDATGACGCCRMRALIDATGALYLFYRAAGGNVDRDSTLLLSTDGGGSFQSAVAQPWNVMVCPMSSYALAAGAGVVYAAWDTDGQVFQATTQGASPKLSAPVAAPGSGIARKHPVIAVGANGTRLLAWTEGTGWNKGGSLWWQLYDPKGAALGKPGRAPGVPVWCLPAAVPRADGGFTLIF